MLTKAPFARVATGHRRRFGVKRDLLVGTTGLLFGQGESSHTCNSTYVPCMYVCMYVCTPHARHVARRGSGLTASPGRLAPSPSGVLLLELLELLESPWKLSRSANRAHVLAGWHAPAPWWAGGIPNTVTVVSPGDSVTTGHHKLRSGAAILVCSQSILPSLSSATGR